MEMEILETAAPTHKRRDLALLLGGPSLRNYNF